MTTQICRPCMSGNSLVLGNSSSRSGRNFVGQTAAGPSLASFLVQQAWKRQSLYSACLGGLSGRRCLGKVQLHGNYMQMPRAMSSEASEESDKSEEHQTNKGIQVLKLVAALLPALLLGMGPALATTAAVTVVGNTAKGFRIAELLASAWTGLMAGCLHTLTGPDHLAALAPLSIGRTRMEGAAVGALWGCGHDAGQVIFGLLFLLLKDRLHIDLLRTWGARVVGVTLLAIGAMGIKEAQELPVPCLAGEECEAEYESSMEGRKKPFGFATFATGIVHGLQPDALLVILPALALPSRVAGIAFLFTFLLGTVVAMASYTAFVGSCSEELQKRVPWITQRLSWGSSLIAIAVGFSILVGEVFGINLF